MLNWPFECETPDGKKHFNFEHWGIFYGQKNREYPCPKGHTRYCLDLIFPAERLEDVWVHWSPFGTKDDPMKGSHDIHFKAENWSTIWDVYPNHIRCGKHDFQEDSNCEYGCRILIEDNHPDPWGEPITLLSTAKTWEDDHATRFVYFRGRYWKTHMPLCYARPLEEDEEGQWNWQHLNKFFNAPIEKHIDERIEAMFKRFSDPSDN